MCPLVCVGEGVLVMRSVKGELEHDEECLEAHGHVGMSKG